MPERQSHTNNKAIADETKQEQEKKKVVVEEPLSQLDWAATTVGEGE